MNSFCGGILALLLTAIWVSGVAVVSGAAEAPAAHAPDLTGVVMNTDGTSLTNASIFIYTAGPRHGAGLLCPSCYADCRKSAQSGPGGEFRIEALDPKLLFQVLVVARGHVPTFFNKVDPLKSPLEAILKPASQTNVPPAQIILGRVLDAARKPVSNAVVSVQSTTLGNRTTGRVAKGTDPLVITDERGEFAVTSETAFDAMLLQVDARGFARGNFPDVRPGQKRRDLVITEGATLTGRVLHDGKPLKNVAVGVAGSRRSAGFFVGHFTIATADTGKFQFLNLPPDNDYDLYGLMDSLQPFGAIPVRTIHVKGDGAETDVGDLEVVPGYRVAGQVRLEDGEPLPSHTRLMLGRPKAWDTATVELPPDGFFVFTNVPRETVTVHARVPGYRLSDKNANRDPFNPHSLAGLLTADKTNLLVLLEKGDFQPTDYLAARLPDGERPADLPLTGAEAKRVVPNAVSFFGKVVDADTKEPLAGCRITPGLSRYPSLKTMIEWYPARAVEASNGTFSLEMSFKTGAIVLRAEADGYLPASSGPLTANQNTITLELKRGEGPHGKLLLPDGKPADGVTVCYLVSGEQAGLDERGKIRVSLGGEGSRTMTDPEGDFSFAPKLGAGEIYAASAAGFARCRAGDLAANGKIIMQSWARLRGRLVEKGKPLADEHVQLEFRVNPLSQRLWFYLPTTRTDEEGRFFIDYVPAGDLQISTRTPLAQTGAFTMQPQRKFDARPGQEIDLGDVEKTVRTVPERPPTRSRP